MDGQLLGVLLGAAAASLVPLVSLRTTQAQWRLEKRIELLRQKKVDLERMYADIFRVLPEALNERSYPISMMGLISVHASVPVRKLYFDHMESGERGAVTLKHLLLEMHREANLHVASIDREIQELLN